VRLRGRADSDETVVALIKAHMRTDRLEMLERVSEDLRGWTQDE
jgi:hypothetical protein